MKIILTGGGTAGHVSPAIAIAEEFKKRNKNTKILFIGRMGGTENEAVLNGGYELKTLRVHGLKRKFTLKNISGIFYALKSVFSAIRIIKSFSPDAIIGTGGYVCWPVLTAGNLLGINTYIHESNLVPGLVTKMLEKGCEKVFVNLDETKEYLKYPRKAITVGNPIRSEFGKISRNQARDMLNVLPHETLIVSFGGSLGAEKMNDTITELMENYSRKKKNIRHLHATGKRYYDKYSDISPARNGCQIVPYINDMHVYLKACDIAICRCGAITLSELATLGIPAVLIPSPNVTNNHQYKNGKLFSDRDAAVMIEEKDLTIDALKDALENLISTPGKLSNMSKNISKLSSPNSSSKIADEVPDKSVKT